MNKFFTYEITYRLSLNVLTCVEGEVQTGGGDQLVFDKLGVQVRKWEPSPDYTLSHRIKFGEKENEKKIFVLYSTATCR